MREMDLRTRSDDRMPVSEAPEEEDSSVEEEESEREMQGAHSSERETATPDSLRRNLQLMAQAAGRLAQLGDDDREDEDIGTLSLPKTRGKKSGSVMVATEIIRRVIDWPHLHVSRRVNGRSKNLTFNELKPEEFVCGFLVMLKNPRNKMDRDVMIEILEMVMQDTVDYSWNNGREFYEKLGIEVEKGALEWTDEDKIQRYRMNYSRAVFPEKKEAKEGTGKPQQRQAPAGMKCCAAFQRHTCDLNRDHHPYSHACNYCFKSTGLMCRHPEDDCIRKTSDESKNAKKREAPASL